MKKKLIYELVKEIAEEKNIEFQEMSYGWIFRLNYKGMNRFIVGNNFDLNTQSVTMILDDKYATYEILNSAGVPIIEHKMLFAPQNNEYDKSISSSYSEAFDYFYKHNQSVVIKPNVGLEGVGVYLCRSLHDVELALSKLFEKHMSVSICPYYNVKREYRTFFLNGNCEFTYAKIRPLIVGDGLKTVRQLLEEFNSHLPSKKIFEENVKNSDMDYVVPKGKEYEFSWKFNLSGGATIDLDIPQEKRQKLEEIIYQIANCINIKFASIDIIEDEKGNFYVMEINSGVTMEQFSHLAEDGREIAKAIYAKAIDLMFE